MPARRSVPGRGDLQKVLQDEMAVLGGNALGMKLDAMHCKRAMRQPHDQTVIGLRCHNEFVRQARPIHHERMVACGLERRIDAAEYAGALMPDLGELAVDGHRSAHYRAAKSLPDRLMSETHAQDGKAWRGLGDQLEADAGIARH